MLATLNSLLETVTVLLPTVRFGAPAAFLFSRFFPSIFLSNHQQVSFIVFIVFTPHTGTLRSTKNLFRKALAIELKAFGPLTVANALFLHELDVRQID